MCVAPFSASSRAPAGGFNPRSRRRVVASASIVGGPPPPAVPRRTTQERPFAVRVASAMESAPVPPAETRTISDVLDKIESAGAADRVSVAEIVERMGDRSFAPLLLVPALVMVSPISSIPGTPTIAGVIIALIAAQMLVGRRTLWLPAVIKTRSVSSARMEKAVAFLKRPAGWVETLIRPRLGFLTARPFSYLVLLTCLAITVLMPIMEFVPMLASVAATAISLFAIGLLSRDGLFVCAGFAVVLLGGLLARTIIG
jgi:hypothetical protein